MRWWSATVEVWRSEYALLHSHPRLVLALVGLLFVPALYAWICLYAIWDPASHTRALPAGLVNQDTGARYRDRELNLGTQVLDAIEREGHFAYRRYADPDAARQDVRRGALAFTLEIPADFSQRALPGEEAGAARLTIYTSEGNNYASAGFARQFAPEVAQRVNTMLAEARWDLVLSSAAGSQRNLESLRAALSELHRATGELRTGLVSSRDGAAQLASGSGNAAEAAQRLRGGAVQVAEGAQQLGGGMRQASGSLRALESRLPLEADLLLLRQGMRSQVEGQRELLRGLEALSAGARQLEGGIDQLKVAAEDVPLFGARLAESLAPVGDGVVQLASGLDRARDGQWRLLQGAGRIDEGVAALSEASVRVGQAVASLNSRLPEETRLDSLQEGSRDLVRGHDALTGGLRQVNAGSQALQGGISRLAEGAGGLDTGIELLRRTLPQSVDRPDGSAQGLALSVQPRVEVAAPVPNQGSALAPNFVPLALWVGAVMVAFLVHLRRIPQPLAHHPRSAIAAGKLALPLAVVLLQALVMLAMLVLVLQVPIAHPAQFVLALLITSAAFLALVWALVRALGDLGKVVAVLLMVIQVSAAGALLPIELSDDAFQVLHPYLPLTWVVQVFRVALFGAFDGVFWPSLGAVATVACAGFALGAWAGQWRAVPADQWKPPLDID